MERARKMILVPEDAYELERERKPEPPVEGTVQTPGDTSSRLDAEMHAILNSKNFKNEREKCMQFLQVLRRYLFFKDNERVEDRAAERELDDIDATLAPLTEEAVIESIPKIYERKARHLLRHWRSSAPDRIKWDNAGTVSIDGRTLENSNIGELLVDAIKKSNKREPAPSAATLQFARLIATTNTPKNLIGNSEIIRIGRVLTQPENAA
jgi:hypothetical protein